ncbi:MAG: peptidoglycan DD-metalloendopeptidase family protein [Ferruginibacter sp.]
MKPLYEILKQHRIHFHKVVDFTGTDIIAPLDLTKNNPSLTEFIFNDTEAFAAYIQQELVKTNARYLIGGYNELREMYKRSALFDFEKKQLGTSGIPHHNITEPRRLHLGIDIWSAAGTAVYAPLGGMVHSFANNAGYGDYGATIILQHQLDTVTFHTLYGHLSLKDIAGLREGQVITRGQPFAHFGAPLENGYWPPHLHFQVIEDMELKEGDYPGVCRQSEAAKYLQNCPDPGLILNMKP